MLKQVTRDEDVVTIGDDLLALTCLYRYLKNMKRVSINDINKKYYQLQHEAIRLSPIFRKFIKQYEIKWNKDYHDFNLFEIDQVKNEFLVINEKIKR